MSKGWYNDKQKHSLASRGIKCSDDSLLKAKKYFGNTSIYEQAGFLMPNGELLSLAKKEDISKKIRETHDSIEHVTGCDLWEFMKLGAVRIHITSEGGQTIYLEMMKPLDYKQQEALKWIMNSRPVVIADVHVPREQGGTSIIPIEFKFKRPAYVINTLNTVTNDWENIKHPSEVNQ